MGASISQWPLAAHDALDACAGAQLQRGAPTCGAVDLPDYRTLATKLLPNGQRDLLLGNGFSMAALSRFAYRAIAREVSVALGKYHTDIKTYLADSDIVDLEVVMADIREGAALEEPDELDPEDIRTIGGDQYAALQAAFIRALSGIHPKRPTFLDPHNWEACQDFAANFHDIYTLNYDLLVYWLNMKAKPDERWRDGFFPNDDDVLTYAPGNHDSRPTITFLHGGLHLYEVDGQFHKLVWAGPGETMITQLQDGLDLGIFPLFIAEGTQEAKQNRIAKSTYLREGFARLARAHGNIITFGVSFGENDIHVLETLAASRHLRSLSLGVFSENSLERYEKVIEKFSTLRQAAGHEPIPTFLYDAASVLPWGTHGVPKGSLPVPAPIDPTYDPQAAQREDPRFDPHHPDYDPDWARPW